MQDAQIPKGLQHPQHPGFVAPDLPYNCRQCINWHGERFGFPPLEEENEEAWHVYMGVLQGQVRVGMEVVGLDYTAIEPAFRFCHVLPEDAEELFAQIVVMDQEASAYRQRRAESQRKRAELQRQGSGGGHIGA